MTSALSTKKTFRDSAIVLRTQDLGETDRIIILATREHGVVHAVAKGIRRSTSKFGARLEPFMMVDLAAASGKQLATVSQVVTRRAYSATIVANYTSFTVAVVITELAEQLMQNGGEPEPRHFELLAGALSSLARSTHNPFRVLDAYIGRSMALSGWGLALSACGICGANDDLCYFSSEVGVLCIGCGRSNQASNVSPISQDLPVYLRALLTGDWESVEEMARSQSLVSSASRLMINYAQWHLERPLKTLSTLEKEF